MAFPVDVRHPDSLLVGKRTAVVGLVGEGEEPYTDRTIEVDPLNVVHLEPFEAGRPPACWWEI
jgi:hypothetical protein